MEQRFQDARSYANCAPIVAATTGVKYFAFSCPAVADPVNMYTIQAAGIGGTELEGIAFTVNESKQRATVVTAHTEAVRRNQIVRFQMVSNLTSGCVISTSGADRVVSMDDATGACDAAASDAAAPRIVQK